MLFKHMYLTKEVSEFMDNIKYQVFIRGNYNEIFEIFENAIPIISAHKKAAAEINSTASNYILAFNYYNSEKSLISLFKF